MKDEEPDGFSYKREEELYRLSIDYLPACTQNEIRKYTSEELDKKPASVMYFSEEHLEEIFENCGL